MNEKHMEHDPVIAALETVLAARRSGVAPGAIREEVRRIARLLDQEEAKLDPIKSITDHMLEAVGEEPRR
jgi:hypothetical protein